MRRNVMIVGERKKRMRFFHDIRRLPRLVFEFCPPYLR